MLEKFSPLFHAEIVLPVLPTVIVLVCALVAALSEIALHYYFHPAQRQELGRLKAYAYGSLAWVLPLLVVFAVLGDWHYILIALLLLGSAGLATWWANHHDADEVARSKAECSGQLLDVLEKARHDPHEQ